MTSILSTAIGATETEEKHTHVDCVKDISLQKICWYNQKNMNNAVLYQFFTCPDPNGQYMYRRSSKVRGIVNKQRHISATAMLTIRMFLAVFRSCKMNDFDKQQDHTYKDLNKLFISFPISFNPIPLC